MLGGAEGLLEQFFSAFQSAGDIARFGCRVRYLLLLVFDIGVVVVSPESRCGFFLESGLASSSMRSC